MAKVINPLLSGDARGQFGKQMIFRKGGVVTKMFAPRNPNSDAQQAQRLAFRRNFVTGLTQAQADLLYAAIIHQHDDLYSLLTHSHDHGDLSGLGDDDHSQYHTNARGDARYSLLAHTHLTKDVIASHGLSGSINASSTSYMVPYKTSWAAALYPAYYPYACEVESLFFQTLTAQPGTGSMVVTLMVNGSATPFTVTVPAGAAANLFVDSAHTQSISAWSTIAWKIQNNATSASAAIVAVGLGLRISIS